MTKNLVSCLLVALPSPRASESLLGSSASSQQKGKERAWRIRSSKPHPHPHSTGHNSITGPHLTARETGRCSLCHGNKLYHWRPSFSSALGFGFGSEQLMWPNIHLHLKNGGNSTCPFLSQQGFEEVLKRKKAPRGTIWSSLFRQGHCHYPHVIEHLPNMTQLVYGRYGIRT